MFGGKPSSREVDSPNKSSTLIPSSMIKGMLGVLGRKADGLGGDGQ